MTGMPGVAYAATPDDGVAYVDENADAVTPDSTVTDDGADAVAEEGSSAVDLLGEGEAPEGAIKITFTEDKAQAIETGSGISKVETASEGWEVDDLYATKNSIIKFEVKTPEDYTDYTATITLTGDTSPEDPISPDSDGVFSYTIAENTTATAIAIAITGTKQTATLTFAGTNATFTDTKATPNTLDATEVVNKGEAFSFKVVPTENYTVTSVTTKVGEAEAQPITATDGVYTITPTDDTTITATAEEDVTTFDVTFTGITNATVLYSTDSETTPATALTDSKATVNSDDSLFFTVTPASDDYTVKSVKVGEVALEATAGVYTISNITEAKTVTIEVVEKETPVETVKLTIAGEKVTSVSYQAFKGESADGDAVTDAALTNGSLEIDVPKNDTVKITKITTKNAYDMITAVKQGETVVEADSEDGFYETAALTDAANVTITTGKMASTGITLVANDKIASTGIVPVDGMLVDGDSDIADDKDKKFVKADTDFAFTLAAVENYKITDLIYGLEGSEETTAIDMTGESYVIPKADILAAVKAGKAIKVTATVVEAKKTITVDAAKAKDATVSYTEYKKTGENTYTSVAGGPVTLDATSGKGTINAETGNVVALKVTPASANVLTSSSVKIGNTKVAPVTDSASGLPVGSYAVEADDAKTVAITQYKKVDVKVTEAEATVSGNSLTITDTKVSPYYGIDGLVNSITVTPQNTQGAYDYEILAPTAKYGNKAITVKTASKPGSYVIDKEDVEKAVEAGKDITITAAAKAIPKSTVTVKVTGDVDTIIYSEFKGISPVDPKHSDISLTLTPDKNDPKVKTGEITFQTGNGLITQVTMGSKYKNVDFLRVTSAEKQFAVLDAQPSTGTYVYSLTGLTNGSTVEVATARIKSDDYVESESMLVHKQGDILVKYNYSSSKPVVGGYATCTNEDTEVIDGVRYYKNSISDITCELHPSGPNSQAIYRVGSANYTVNGRSAKPMTRKISSAPDCEYYMIPASDLLAVAFAPTKEETVSSSSESGEKVSYKVAVTATAVESGYKPQPVAVITDKTASVDVVAKDNGKGIDSKEGLIYRNSIEGANFFDTALDGFEFTYGNQATMTITANPGFALDEVSLLSNTDYEAALKPYLKTETSGGSRYTYLPTLTTEQKAELDKTLAAKAKKQTIADDGTCTISIASVKTAYKVFVTTEDKLSLTLDGEEIDNTFDTAKELKYITSDVPVALVSGSTPATIASVEAKVVTGKTDDGLTYGATVTETVFPEFAEAEMATFSLGEAVAGKTIEITVNKKVAEGEEAVSKVAYFKVTEKIDAEAFNIADPGYELVIGSTKTITLTGKLDNAKYTATLDTPLISVAQGVDTTADKSTLTLSSKAADWDSLKTPATFTLTLTDAVNKVTIDTATISVIPSTLTVEAISGLAVVPMATANSIVMNIDASTVNPAVMGLDGLYYRIKLNTLDDTFYDRTITKIVPVNGKTQSYTVKLTENTDYFSAKPVNYTGSIELIQATGIEDGEFKEIIAPSVSNGIALATDKLVTKTNVYLDNEGKEHDVIYATKLKVNKLLGKTKVYTGMAPIDVISVEYPDPAKDVHVTDHAQKLQKVELVNTKTKEVWNTDYDPDVISEDNDVVTIYPENIAAGSYKVVAYALEPLGKEVTATYSFKVLQGIEDLSVTAPTTRIYKAPGKAATVKAALTYDPAKPATKKVVWSIADKFGEDITISGISVKNGKVTVDKNLAFDEDIEFTVKAAAADYAGNDAVGLSDPITLTTTVSQPAYLTMDDEPITNNKKDYISDDIDGKTLGACTADGNEIENVTFKVSGAAKLEKGKLVVTKLGKVNITATVTDGSVKKPFKVSFSIASDSGLLFTLCDVTEINGIQAGSIIPGVTEYPFTNAYAASESMKLEIGSRSGSLIANTVSIKGGKAINKNKVMNGHNYYEITPSAHETVITITDKSVKPAVKYTINVTNTKVAAVKTAPKVVASNKYDAAFKDGKPVVKDNKGKIFSHLEFGNSDTYTDAGAYNDVTYTVSAKDLKVTKALLAVTKDDEDGDFSDCVMANTTNGVVTLGEGGTFTIRYADNYGNFDIPKGTYTFTVTPIDDEGNAIAKTATVKVTAAPAPKAKVTVKTVTLKDFKDIADLGFGKLQNVVVESGGEPVTHKVYAMFGAERKPRVLGINSKGVINRFASYFDVTLDGKLKCTTEPTDGVGGYSAKSGISGWVAYTYMNLDGSETLQYVKVKVIPKSGQKIVPYVPEP